MTDLNTDKTTEYGVEYHDEFETTFHAHEENDPKLGTQEEWEKRHSDKTLEVYCDMHPSAPECRVYDD
jgi:hypothetical protein